jgi:NAD(P)-dependent dehydrogenase (short-subunit alcohol dehydrogenase family)
MKGERVVVTGISGNVGWGVASALLSQGADVIGITRSAKTAESVASSLGNPRGLTIETGDLSDAVSAVALRDRIEAKGGVNHFVAALGPWWQKGPIVDQSIEEYIAVRAGLQDAHVHAAMAFIPHMRYRAGSSYTIISGQGSNMAIPGTGLLVVATNAVLGLSRMLREEHKADAVRVNEVMIGTRIEKAPREGVIHAPRFGEEIVKLLVSDTRSQVLHYSGSGMTV